MKKYLFFHWNPVLICVIASLVSAQTPVVTNTIPPNGAKNVDPLLTEIKIVFSAPVKMNSWSFVATGKGEFPENIDQPYFPDNKTWVSRYF